MALISESGVACALQTVELPLMGGISFCLYLDDTLFISYLRAIVAHCRHNNFVLVSSLVMKNPLVNSGLLANVSEANARNLEAIASLIADLLVCLNTPEDTRLVPSATLSC